MATESGALKTDTTKIKAFISYCEEMSVQQAHHARVNAKGGEKQQSLGAARTWKLAADQARQMFGVKKENS